MSTSYQSGTVRLLAAGAIVVLPASHPCLVPREHDSISDVWFASDGRTAKVKVISSGDGPDFWSDRPRPCGTLLGCLGQEVYVTLPGQTSAVRARVEAGAELILRAETEIDVLRLKLQAAEQITEAQKLALDALKGARGG